MKNQNKPHQQPNPHHQTPQNPGQKPQWPQPNSPTKDRNKFSK